MQTGGVVLLENNLTTEDRIEMQLLLRDYFSLDEEARRWVRIFTREIARGRERKRRKAQEKESQVS